MSKQTIVVVFAALVLFGTVLGGSLAFIGNSSDTPVHTLPGGQIHTGELPTTGQHTMLDGSTMPGMDHDG